MTNQQVYHFFKDRWKSSFLLAGSMAVFITFNIFSDYWFTRLQNSSFYFSESLLFSSFWILFIPLLYIQNYWIKATKKLSVLLLITGLMILIHLTVYPALVWLLSKIGYDHTFPYIQTFNFGLTAYLIKTVIIYASSSVILTILKNKVQHPPQTADEITEKTAMQSMVVSDMNNTKIIISLKEVLYFSANTPYITIHHSSKKYLHHETLKSLEAKLDGNQFVRIHKSHMINLNQIISYQSRQNGDYNITLSDQTVLRASRSYAKDFKPMLDRLHLTSK
ncbi:histidine kinase [Chryseobacterium angstadtii]|uniref:Histidine kinase n=1 Tax=Chryseobacterium angstadtii TaxID=558151 RepID=A0A0J7I0Y3_9FLAO|nr:LytTR family DNA-binding domain-containing protein [Chryseobacterium angstadtii]KMQ59471.1 histidine kinase [Chryseobacterium angstadtii]